MSGFIYLFSNESMPGLVKVGLTARSPSERAAELSTTGVPTPFKVQAYWECPQSIDLKTLEASCHKKLSRFRVSNKREFFNIEVNKAKEILSKLIPTQEQVDEQLRQDEIRKEQAHKESLERMIRREKAREEEERRRAEHEGVVAAAKEQARVAEITEIEEKLRSPDSVIGIAIDNFIDMLTAVGGLVQGYPLIVICSGFGFFISKDSESLFETILVSLGFGFFGGVIIGFVFMFIGVFLIGLLSSLRRALFGESHYRMKERLEELITNDSFEN